MSFSKIFGGVKIIPVATFDDPEQAVRIARKLAADGMPAIEVTLRTATRRWTASARSPPPCPRRSSAPAPC